MALNGVKNKIGLIKKLAIFFGLSTQIYNVFYLGFKIYNGNGYKLPNIILLIISSVYLLFNLFTTKTEYTQEQKLQRKRVKKFYKVSKKLVRGLVIAISIYEIYTIASLRTFTNVVMTGFLAFTFILTVILDLILNTISRGVKNLASEVSDDFTDMKNSVGKAKTYLVDKHQENKQQRELAKEEKRLALGQKKLEKEEKSLAVEQESEALENLESSKNKKSNYLLNKIKELVPSKSKKNE